MYKYINITMRSSVTAFSTELELMSRAEKAHYLFFATRKLTLSFVVDAGARNHIPDWVISVIGHNRSVIGRGSPNLPAFSRGYAPVFFFFTSTWRRRGRRAIHRRESIPIWRLPLGGSHRYTTPSHLSATTNPFDTLGPWTRASFRVARMTYPT